jgi:uncharacterized NAD(P)/FAD-binding protein YdhS
VTQKSTFDVAIVGGGASGTLLAIQLLRRAPPGWRRILLVDRSGDFARGLAYRTREKSHLLNVPAARMSALPEDEGHFLAWLKRRMPNSGPDTYARRNLYGDYLAQLLAEAERGAPGLKLQRRKAEVRALEETAAGIRLRFNRGPDAVGRFAVLALGNPQPARLPVSRAASSRVQQLPWPLGTVLPGKKASVLLVGAGLTAVDWVLALRARGHSGPLHVLSRHGLLPNAHSAVAVKPLALGQLPLGKIRPLVRALRRAAENEARDWREAVDGLRPLALVVWRALGEAERLRFGRHVRTRWEVLRHRLAPDVAARVQHLRTSGQLHVHAGHLLSIARRGRRLEVRYRPRGQKDATRLSVDLVVNCTGPVGHATQPDKLVSALLRSGRARPGPLGLGLATSSAGALVDARGQASARVWTLGPVRRGDAWESTAVPDIRLQVAALAERLTQTPLERGEK